MLPINPPADLIESVLSLPPRDRLAVMNAIHASLADPTVDHGPVEDRDLVEAEWNQEIQRRLTDLENGVATTVSVEEAERRIRGDAG